MNLVGVDFRNCGGSRIISDVRCCCVPNKLPIKDSGELSKDNMLKSEDFLRVIPEVNGEKIKVADIDIGKPSTNELDMGKDDQGCSLNDPCAPG